MALQTTGQITLKDIATEFDDTAPHSLKEFYSAAATIPASGEITLKSFYGVSSQILLEDVATPTVINGYNTLQEIVASDYVDSGGVLVIPADWWIWSDSTATAALTIDIPCTVINNGKIIGKGGKGSQFGNPEAGGPAISCGSVDVTIQNNSGAYIAGGGGGGGTGNGAGGGGGAGGGRGGDGYYYSGGWKPNGQSGGAGGGIGQIGSGAALDARGGGSGGGGGGRNSAQSGGGGAGGGRILPGVGGKGGDGVNNIGQSGVGSTPTADNSNGGSGYNGGGGGGGWGAAGSNAGGGGGAAGGAAVSGTTLASYTNNGTVYGTVVSP